MAFLKHFSRKRSLLTGLLHGGKLVALCLILSLPLIGCSKFTYKLADWYVMRTIDRYLELTDTQKDWVQERVRWHFAAIQKDDIPRFLVLISNLQQQMREGWSQQTFEQMSQRHESLLDATITRILPDVAKLLSELSALQLQHFRERLTKEQDDFYDYLSEPQHERQQKREQAFIDKVENWVGRIDKQQQQQILQGFRQLEDRDDLWRQYAQTRIDDFLQLLMSQPSAHDVEQFLYQRYLYGDQSMPEHLNQVYERQVQQSQALGATIANLLKPKQRQYFIDKLQGYADKLQDLMQVELAHLVLLGCCWAA